MKLFKEIARWINKLGKKEFTPRVESVTIELKPEIIRKNKPVTLLSKGGTRYRLIKPRPTRRLIRLPTFRKSYYRDPTAPHLQPLGLCRYCHGIGRL